MNQSYIHTFESHRAALIGLAYRMTGSRSDAEDIVAEVCIKWLDADHASINSAYAWLTKVTTRMALDYLKSAKVQRESYIGPWLPEPYVEEREIPDNQHQLDQSLSLALMVLLESLTPSERAAYILHDLFNYSFDEIGGILNKQSASCRKLASRARGKIQQEVPETKTTKDDIVETAEAFFSAIRQGEMEGLLSLFRDDVSFHSDSDGKAAAAKMVLYGSSAVARFLMKVLNPVIGRKNNVDIDVESTWFNGLPGYLIIENGKVISAFSFVVENGLISQVFVHRNPEKLALLA